MRLYIDISLNIEKLVHSESIFTQQKSSLGYLDFIDPKIKKVVIRFSNHSFHKVFEHYEFYSIKCDLTIFFAIYKAVKLIKSYHSNQHVSILYHGFNMPLRFLFLKHLLGNQFKMYAQHHSDQPFQNPIKRYFQKKALHTTDGYFFSTKLLAQNFITEKIITDESKITEIMEGSNSFRLLDKKTVREQLKLNHGLTFLWVGRLTQNKDPLTVLKAFKEFVAVNLEAKLYMVFGTSELIEQVKQFINSHHLSQSVVLLGRVEQDQLEKWYNAADVFISASYYESSSYALCEAMACGCFPLLSKIPSFGWMTNNHAFGESFEVGNENDLLKKMIALKLDAINTNREKIRAHFDNHLSFKAIANSISKFID